MIGGIGAFMGWDSNLINIIRILFAVITAFTYVWPFSLIYLIAWMVIPPANTPRRILEQQGQPVTVDTISQTVLSSVSEPLQFGKTVVHETSNVLTNIMRFIGRCFMGLIGLAGAATTIIAIGFFLFFLVSLISYWVFDSTTLLFQYNHFGWYRHNYIMGAIVDYLACMCFAACFMLPGIALSWGAMKVLFNCKGISKSTVIFSILLEIVLVVTTIILIIYTHAL